MFNKYEVKNGTPQGSVISPILFLIIIHDIFSNVPVDMGRSLFADDRVLWKRGRNLNHIVKKSQEGINQVEVWCKQRGFKLSVDKKKVMFFTRKRLRGNNQLKLYGNILEIDESFKFFGLHFDSRLTWRQHVKVLLISAKGL